MKKLGIFCFILFSTIISAQCPDGDLVFTSQTDIDNFSLNYPSCSSTSFSITIEGGDISSVFGLSPLTNISGSLIIRNTSNLSSLLGIASLMSIGGELIIENNSELWDIRPLNGVDGGTITSLIIADNPNIRICDIPVICNFVGDNLGSVLIQNNKEGCNTEEEILYSCDDLLCPSGDILLYNQDDIDDFLIEYPNCRAPRNVAVGRSSLLSAPITNLNGLSRILKVRGNFIIGNNGFETSLTDFTGLESLKRVEGDIIFTDNLELTSLNGLEALEYIGGDLRLGRNIVDNQSNPLLTDISALSSLEFIGGDLNIDSQASLLNLNGLEMLDSIGGSIIISRNDNLLNVDALNNLSNLEINGDISFKSNSSLERLPNMSTVTRVSGGIIIWSNPMLNSLMGLNSIEDVGRQLHIRNSDGLNDLVGLDNLVSVVEIIYIQDNNQLVSLDGLEQIITGPTTIRISQNDALSDISGISNVNLKDTGYLYISGNPNLAICNEPNICEYLIYGGVHHYFNNNSTGCSSFDEVIAGCSSYFNTITGDTRYDIDNDGCDNTYSLVSNILFESTDGVATYGTFGNSNGMYEIYVPEGIFTTTPVLNNANFSVSPISQDSNFTDVGNTDILNTYCLVPEVSVNDANITILPLTEARPGFDADYKLVVQNTGTNSLSGSIVFQFDDVMQTFVSSSISPIGQVSGQLTFEYNNLAPFVSLDIDLTMSTLPPPTVNEGDLLNFTATVNPTIGDASSNNNIYVFEQIVINSFDPNDKQVLQGDEIFIDEIDNYLDYIIRFQNTGSASAVNVRIKDDLVENLDWSTFSPISMSHSGTIQITNGKHIEFIFEGINLPDETSDEEGSKGFVAFKIKPKTDVILGDVIVGNAEIYFDFNSPIITNTVSTEIVDNSLSTNENILEDSFFIYPNPTNDIINIATKLDVVIKNVKLYSVLGKLLFENNNERIREINLKPFPKGMYFLNVVLNNGSVTKKIIKN